MLRRVMMAAGSTGGDPYWSNVVSLLNFVGADGATTTTDARGLDWTFSGNAQIDTAASANGTSSLLLDGTGDYISTPDAAALRSDVSIFTMDGYARRNAAKLQTICSKRNSAANEFSLYVQADNTLRLICYSGTTPAVDLAGATAIATGAFFHWEVGRSGTSWYLFLNGNLEATGTQTVAPGVATSPLYIGREVFSTARDFNGWIGAFRRTNGVIRHTASFTPPAAPFPTA